MFILAAPEPLEANEHALRRQIDSSLSRALFDTEFAQQLLSDPTHAVNGCTPRQHHQLRSIRAHDLADFAQQAQALFWVGSNDERVQYEEEVRQATAIVV